MKILTSILVIVFISPILLAQSGGNNTYEALNLVTSARVAALSGNAISVKDDDIDLAWDNPSILNESMSNNLVLNYVDYLADINYTSFIYSKSFSNLGSFSAGMKYLHYGTFKETDYTGEIIREFNAQDVVFNLGWGRGVSPILNLGKPNEKRLDSIFFVGGNLKFIYSNYHFDYSSFGIAVDLAGTYHNHRKNTTIAAIIKNAGIQIKPYTSKNREPLPFEIQLGISQKLKHAPFRLMLNVQHLERWDLTYTDPTAVMLPMIPEEEDTLLFQKIGAKVSSFGDKLLRHAIFGTEIILSKNFHVRLGYNYQRRKELKLATKRGMSGFSFGLGFKVSKFHFSYGRSSFHLAGGTNHFSIRTNLDYFYNIRTNEMPNAAID